MVFSVGDNISDTGNMRFVASKLESIKKSIEKYKRAKTELSYTDIWGAFGKMLLPCGADKCPECGENGTLRWVDEEKQEMDAKDLDCLGYVRELRIDDYLSPTTLEEIAEEIKKKVNRGQL